MATAETNTPRHGRHSAAGRHAAPVPSTPAPEAVETTAGVVQEAAPAVAAVPLQPQESIADLVPIIDGDQETSMGDAPRPIDVDPSETGSFRRIEASEGARLTTRANASETGSFMAQNARPVEAVRMSTAGRPKVEHREVEVKSNRRVFIILGIAALVVVAIVGTLLGRALTSVENIEEETVAEQMQAAVNEPLEYRGTVYAVSEQEGGGFALTSTSEGSEGSVIQCMLLGRPVTLILYNTVFVIPENLGDGTWDLIAHPLGEGSVTQQVTDASGSPVIGQGEIAEATLVGDGIQIVTTTGENLTVSLV